MIMHPVEPDDPRLAAFIAAAADEMRPRYAGTTAGPMEADPRITYLVAEVDGVAVGCGGLQPDGEIRRVYVDPAWRRRGVARALLAALEAQAAAAGWPVVRLETGVRQPEALALYDAAGYRRVPAYGAHEGDPYAVCFEKLLLAVHPCPADDPELLALVAEQQKEIIEAEGPGAVVFPLHDGIAFMLARLGGSPVGCGALQPLGDGYGEVKRMYTAPAWRGRGLARQVLAALEARAVEAGWHTLRLETGRDMPAARALYTAAGYAEIPNFGQYVGYPASLCLEKRLSAPLV